jgi:septum formation protein
MVAMIEVPFVVHPAGIDESSRPGESPRAYLERVAGAKLEAVCACDLGPASAVLVADTVVVAPDGSMLGKPADDHEPLSMIERLAGKTHEVSTRFVLADRRTRAVHAETVTTKVTFRPIAQDEARAYAASGEGRDKAGGYAVQGKAATFVERIEGSYTNVVGLPLCQVLVAMRGLGLLAPARTR